jgi:hypothetical protein
MAMLPCRHRRRFEGRLRGGRRAFASNSGCRLVGMAAQGGRRSGLVVVYAHPVFYCIFERLSQFWALHGTLEIQSDIRYVVVYMRDMRVDVGGMRLQNLVWLDSSEYG